MPPDSERKAISPGVIFCLKHTGTFPPEKNQSAESINPLQPYFLVFIRDDANVRFNFAHPKQILEIYRRICAEKTVPYQHLCQLFDTETKDGTDMSRYSSLLDKALASIAASFRKRTASALQSGRGGLLVPTSQQPKEEDEFELVTWLVIRSEVKTEGSKAQTFKRF